MLYGFWLTKGGRFISGLTQRSGCTGLMLLPLLMYGLILWLLQRLDAFDMWSLRKIPRIPCTRRNHQRHCQGEYIPIALQFVLLFKQSALFLRYKRISSRITTESLMSRFDHHFIGEDLKGTTYHVAEGNWCWRSIGQHWDPVSLEEGWRAYAQATYHPDTATLQ